MSQNPFGGPPTETKLDVISEYLRRYKQVLEGARKKYRWEALETVYIDAFAGSGIRPFKPSESSLFGSAYGSDPVEVEEFKTGSALRALEGELTFNKYIFIESRKNKLDELKKRLDGHELEDQCTFSQGDANNKIAEIIPLLSHKDTRSVVFLDPFGNSVEWATIEALARTHHVDLWYLFPAGNGVFRQISNDGKVTPESAKSLTKIYGTDSWKKEFIRKEERRNLFGQTVETRKNVTPETATNFMIERMRSVFKGGVITETLPLGDQRNGYPLYSLIFAWANPSKKAGDIAEKIAKAIIKSKGTESGWLL